MVDKLFFNPYALALDGLQLEDHDEKKHSLEIANWLELKN